MKVEVECHAGYKADERPLRFRLDGREHGVEQVIDQWYGPASTYFKVLADDGNLYILREQTSTPGGAWDLVAFRHAADMRP